jgi:lambda family phage portal protein
VGWFDRITKGRTIALPPELPEPPAPVQMLADLDTYVPTRARSHNGDKFPGGFGVTELLTADYWTLRARSAQLFKKNLYARGIVRRLVTNTINTGLHLEATPHEALLGYPEDGLAEWAELTESRFELWSKNPALCDHQQRLTFGALQATAYQEALIDGDVLVTLLQDAATQLPRVSLIDAGCVRSPMDDRGKAPGNTIKHGVELDPNGRQVAYWIRKVDAASAFGWRYERLAAFGAKTGRRTAWLVYGSDKRHGDVRGEPLLAIVLQSLNEIDRFRDSTQRKAAILATLTAWIEKTEDKPGSKPLAGGAIKRGTDTAADSTGTPRTFNAAEYIPGLVIDELQHGEKPHAFQVNGTTETFSDFEAAVLASIAWSLGIPPEILVLSFQSNYSASKAAINEFKLALNVWRQNFGEQLCQPIYEDWLISQALTQRIDAPKLLEAWRDPMQYEALGAWTSCDWTGQIKPEIDMGKIVDAFEKACAGGFMTRDRASRELTGTKYSQNIKKLGRENQQLADALKPLAPPEPVMAPPSGGAPGKKNEPDDDEESEEDALDAEPLEAVN